MSNYALHTDLYQINMAYSYFKDNRHKNKAVFEIFFRNNPFNGGYCVFTGLEKIIEVINNYSFDENDIEYLRGFNLYDEDFLEYLSNLRFSGNIYSVLEGEIIFANEPFMIIESNLIEAQLLETILLNIVNFHTLISTKASKIRSVTDKKLVEFGARRGHESEASLWGSRSAYISGFSGTSLLSAGEKFNIPVFGTHAHSFIQVYGDEEKAFLEYAKNHKNVTFLIDTYDTLNSGILNAIKVANYYGDKINFNAVRIDSGDLAYLSKECRKILDKNGYKDTKIMVSNDIDEKTINSLKLQGACIDIYGIGTKLITAYDNPSLGAVYKLVNIERDGKFCDVLKISNTIEKVTTPCMKQIYRLIKNGKYVADFANKFDCKVDEDMYIYNEKLAKLYKKIDYDEFNSLLKCIYKDGKLVYDIPNIESIRKYHMDVKNKFSDEVLRYDKPDDYFIGVSKEIYNTKINLLHKNLNKGE